MPTSAQKPSRTRPRSRLTRSPAATFRLPGMPCTASSLIETQIDRGKPLYPRKPGVAPPSRISRSAMRSSSMVLTPGSHASFRGGSTDASKLPARAMRSISWAVFRLIICSSSAFRRLGPPTRPLAVLTGQRGGGDGGHHLLAYLLDCAHAVDLGNQALAAVVVEHGNRLLEVHLDPRLDRFGLVVFALDELMPVGQARGGPRRVGALALRADEAAGQAPEQLLEVHLEVENPVEMPAQLEHQRVQGLGLRDGAWEAVDDETAQAVGLHEPVANHPDHDVVRHVVARRQDRLRLQAERSAGRDLR